MNAKINEILNLFINISGEKYNISELLDELDRIDKRIPELNDKIAKLKAGMTEDKYFDASSEIIDRNIEISLQKKLDHLYNRLKVLKDQNEELLNKHRIEEERFSNLNKNLESCQSFVHDLQGLDFESSSANVQRLIDMENDRFELVLNEINSTQDNRNKVGEACRDINEEIAKLEKTIQTEEDRLFEVKESLKTKKSYVNEELKSEDLRELNDYETEINDLQNKKEEIINSITYQSNLIREELNNPNFDRSKVMDIAKGMASNLNSLPYLSVEDDTILTEEFGQLSSKRDELTAVIENTKYSLKNKKPYELRIEYVNQKLSNAQDIKEDYESLLNFILNQEIEVIIDNLVKLKNEQREMMNAFANNSKAELQKEFMDELLNRYENDLAKTLAKAKDISSKIGDQDREIAEAKQEIETINRENKLDFDLENQVEKELDNRMLEEVTDKLKYLNSRIRVGITPNQLCDQIEMLLDSNGEDPKNEPKEPIEIEKPIIKNISPEKSQYTFEKVDNSDSESYDMEDMIVSADKFLNDTKEEKNKEFSFSPIDNTGFVSFDDAYDIAN